MKTIPMAIKTVILLLLLALSAAGADVDAKLYDAADKEAYYNQVRKQIDTMQSDGNFTKAQASEARMGLERLRRAATAPAPSAQEAGELFTSTPLTSEQANKILRTAVTARVQQNSTRQRISDVQSKLAFLKQTIDGLGADDRARLLSNQLQFAYYKLQQKRFEDQAEQLGRYSDAIVAQMQKHVKSMRCTETTAAFGDALAKAEAAVEKQQQRKVAANIALERAQLEGSSAVGAYEQKAKSAAEAYVKAGEAKLALQSQMALCLLRAKDNKAFFSMLDSIDSGAAQLDRETRRFYEAEDGILRTLAKSVLGVTGLVLGDTLHETKALLIRIGKRLSAPLFVFNERPISFLSLIKAVLILIFGFFFGTMYKRWIARLANRWPDMSQMSMRLASNIGYYLIVIIALFIAVSSLGINMTSISLIAGALSIGVGFGLQTVVSNFIAGIILMFERTIRIGDMIEISGELRGRVTDMRIRSTTVKTFDNIDIVVPNSSFIQNNVINWTLEDITRRLHIPFGVAYGTEVEAVKAAVLDELEASSLTYIKNNPDKAPEVWMVGMNSSSVDFELLVWVEWGNKARPNALRSDFLILIYDALYKNGIQIPFPQLDLYVKQLPERKE